MTSSIVITYSLISDRCIDPLYMFVNILTLVTPHEMFQEPIDPKACPRLAFLTFLY